MLAIVVPYYKLTFFEATLKSLANQIDKRFKVYIGDDASPENPADLLQQYKGKFDFEYHRFERNLGGISLTQQWERCIALSGEEEWLMILGDDDFLDCTVVESWYRNYMIFAEKSNVVRFATKVVLEDSKTISKTYIHPLWETSADAFVRIFKQQTRSSLSEYIFSKKIYLKFGFINYPLAWCSDYMALLDFSDGKLIYTINESVVYFRISTINISGQQNNEFFKNEINIRFFKDVVVNKINLFEKKECLELLMAYEIAIKRNREPTFYEWFFIIQCYIIKFKWVSFAKCARRFCISIFQF
jgi:glycosyltransferase involved in cell wall biosynthesis